MTFTTAYGKDVAPYIDKTSSMYRIKFVQGGELPECLEGIFTSEARAIQAIVSYIESDKPKAKNVKEK
jgi:hypothetical protein